MKSSHHILTFLMVAGSCLLPCVPALAGPSGGQSDFIESSRRQDFTGKGTYHRQGLFREQDRVIRAASVKREDKSAKTDGWSWLRNLFRKKP